jgi:hypothetical protein
MDLQAGGVCSVSSVVSNGWQTLNGRLLVYDRLNTRDEVG